MPEVLFAETEGRHGETALARRRRGGEAPTSPKRTTSRAPLTTVPVEAP